MNNSGADFRIWELIPNPIRNSHMPVTGRRLNLVIPVISRKWVTLGGPATALRFFEKLAAEFTSTRIIVTHETETDFNFMEWPDLVLDEEATAKQSIMFLGDRSKELTVLFDDFFIATFWSTAIFVRRALTQQANFFGIASRRFVYLVQDYEPGFYPWSARYVAAESTYRDRERAIAVFNTTLLADYFDQNGLRFNEKYVFHPVLHPKLRSRKRQLATSCKERLILAYARPSEQRNDFDFVVDVLKIWANEFPEADLWSVISAGEPHGDISLGKNVVLRSRGLMNLEEYADHLSRCWVGVSFMFSPHPSYPPLEMAEFGAWVVTNRFANKNPELIAPSIIAVAEAWPEQAARKLAWCCEQYLPGKSSATFDGAPIFKSDGDEFPFSSRLTESWTATR